MSAITDLEAKVQSLENQLQHARKYLEEARREACPVKIGMVVVCDGKEFRVSRIWFPSWKRGEPCLAGNPRKRDGSFSDKIERELWREWKVRPQEETQMKLTGGAA